MDLGILQGEWFEPAALLLQGPLGRLFFRDCPLKKGDFFAVNPLTRPLNVAKPLVRLRAKKGTGRFQGYRKAGP